MSAMVISGIVLACVVGGGLLGMALRAVLPSHHLSTDSKDVVKVGTGLIATMAALVLGLLIAAAKGSYDAQSNELTLMSTNVILLDRVLAHYGPETSNARDQLRRSVVGALDRLWPDSSPQPVPVESQASAEVVYDRIQKLVPENEVQRSSQAQALKISMDIAQTRWLLKEQQTGSIPMPFLVVLAFWLTMLFVSFGLFAPPNATIAVTLLVCALSVSCAIYLILELDQPFDGLMRISSAPLREALAHLGQ